MILVDTSVWVDHLRRGDARLREQLEKAAVLAHDFVIGEIACGNLVDRVVVLDLLNALPKATMAQAEEVLTFIDGHRLHGKGLGYVDVHLLAAVALTPRCDVVDSRQASAFDRGGSRLRAPRGSSALGSRTADWRLDVQLRPIPLKNS